ncbi:hypothetical protein M405DRAFT_935492 [Rhizopogon salebrosus TDB-379]|nr:hypothetical protein M405DRAFT_935492 [Rhizopogon salebrosus TDB-379]
MACDSRVWPGSTERVLGIERVEGVSIGDAVIGALPQEERNEIVSRIIELCLRELFQFRLMQTDSNFTNFLWNSRSQQLSLVDVGATREYKKEFMDDWPRLLQAAASEDRTTCAEKMKSYSTLTNGESQNSVGMEFQHSHPLNDPPSDPFQIYDSTAICVWTGTPWADITARVWAIKHRLTPPPRETYSLNRKLSGAFLLTSKLRAIVDTKKPWDLVVSSYKFGTPKRSPPQGQKQQRNLTSSNPIAMGQESSQSASPDYQPSIGDVIAMKQHLQSKLPAEFVGRIIEDVLATQFDLFRAFFCGPLFKNTRKPEDVIYMRTSPLAYAALRVAIWDI